MTMRKAKLAIVCTGVTGLVAGGILMGVIPAFASTSSPSSTQSVATPSTNHAKYHPNWLRRVLLKNADQVASDLHIKKAQLVQDLSSGKSLDDVAMSSDVQQSSLQNDIQTMIQSDLQGLVTNGHMTATREAKLVKNLDARLPKFMENKHLIQKPMKFKATMNVLHYVATQLHMTRTELVTQLKSGKSITQIATAQGVSPSTLQSTVTQKLDTQVNTKVQNLFNKTNWFQNNGSVSITTSK